MIDRFKQLVFGSYTDFFEVFNVFILIGWGTWLLLPFNSFASSKAFVVLQSFVSEQVFGLVPILIGLYIFHTLITLRVRRRRYGILAASAFWIFIAIVIGASNIASTGVAIYGLIAVFSALSYLRQ